MKQWRRWMACACALLAFAGSARSAEASISAVDVKSAFLFNFLLYVDWPKDPVNDAFVISVLGDEDVSRHLATMASGRTVRDRSVRIRPLKSLGELGATHILYVGAGAVDNLPRIRTATKGKAVLLVSDHAPPIAQRSAINFVTVGNRLRFEVSMGAAQDAGLVLSSRLLGAAVRVERSGLSVWGDEE